MIIHCSLSNSPTKDGVHPAKFRSYIKATATSTARNKVRG